MTKDHPDHSIWGNIGGDPAGEELCSGAAGGEGGRCWARGAFPAPVISGSCGSIVLRGSWSPRVLSMPRAPLLSVVSCGWQRFLKTCALCSVDNHVFLLLVCSNLYCFKRKRGRGCLGALGAPLPCCAACRVLWQFFVQLLVGRKGDGVSVVVSSLLFLLVVPVCLAEGGIHPSVVILV